jgi:hypothetical protein
MKKRWPVAQVLALAAIVAINPIKAGPVEGIDNPSAYCQGRLAELAEALRPDAKDMANLRNNYANYYARCMQAVVENNATKARAETEGEKLKRDDTECQMQSQTNTLLYNGQLNRNTWFRRAALERYFRQFYDKCMTAKGYSGSATQLTTPGESH